MSRRNRKEKEPVAPKPGKTFIPMPDEFNRAIQQIMAQAQMRAQDKVSTAIELRSDIPKDWVYNSETGGFSPLPKEGVKPDATKREGEG